MSAKAGLAIAMVAIALFNLRKGLGVEYLELFFFGGGHKNIIALAIK